MYLRNDLPTYLEREAKRIKTLKENRRVFPLTGEELAAKDILDDHRESSRHTTIKTLPDHVKAIYLEETKRIKTIFPDVKIYACGSAVNGGYVDNTSDEILIWARTEIYKKELSDIDIYIEGDYKKEELPSDLKVSVVPFSVKKILIE